MAADGPELSVSMLGNFAMAINQRPFVMATPRQTLPLIAYLLLNRGTTFSREFVAYFMWPDDSEESARAKLRANLYDLVRVLPPAGEPWVLVDGNNVSWNPDARVRLDTEAFEALCADPEGREAGVELYRGELLATLYDEWIFPVRERFRNLYLAMLTELISSARRRREFPRAIGYAQQLLAEDPWREDIVRRLIAIRYESGDRSGALVEFQGFAGRTRAELDIGPMPETIALRDAIARDGPIDPEPPARARPAATISAMRSLPFVGRGSEFELLADAWSRAALGNGSAVFIGGESGIGKSRLALEFAHRAEDLGGRVMFGSTGTPEALPYQSIIEALRSALPLVAALRVRDVWLAGVATLVPELRSHLPALPDLPRIDAVDERPRLFESLFRTLVGLSAPRPLLIVLDDVQWAGEATSAAIEFLVGRVSQMHVLLVLTYRDDELPRLHPLQRLRRDATIAGSARSLSLRPLSVDDVDELMRSLPNAPAGTAAALRSASDGSPLFLTQFIESDSTNATDLGAGTVRTMVVERLDKLSPDARTFAEIAALVGAQFSGEVVRRVAGWDGGSTEDALDELIDRRIVREASGRGLFDYAFAHHVVQQTVAESAEVRRAAARHRRIARALDELYPERAAELAARVARHYDLAGDANTAASRYLAAAHQALSVGAVDEAAASVARGLELSSDAKLRIDLLFVDETVAARRLKDDRRAAVLAELDALTAPAGDEEARRTALLRRAAFAGERKDRQQEATALAELRRLVEAGGDRIWLGRLAGAEALHFLETDDIVAAESSAEASLAAFIEGGEHAEEAEARRRLAEIVTLRGDVERAGELFTQARVAGDRADDATLSLRALKGLYQLAFYRGDIQRCCAIAQEQLDLGLRSGDRRFEAEGHVAMAKALDMQRIRRKHARAHLAAATAIFEEVRFPVGLAVSLVVTATHLCWTGELADARACSERAMQIYATHPPPARLKITGLLTLAIATLLSGDGARAKPHALEAAESARTNGYRLLEAAALGNLADAEAVAGEYAAAIEHLRQSMAIWSETSSRLPNEDAHIALWSAVLGDLATARTHAFRALEGDAAFRDTSFWPQERFWSIAQALRACGETESAATALERARALTVAALEQIDEGEHELFLALPWHRDLIAAAEHNVWPDPPR